MDNAKLAALCGPQNRHLALMEKRLDVRIKQRGMRFVISGPVPSAQAALQALEDLYQRADNGLEVEDVHLGLVHAEQLSEKQLDNNPNPGQKEPAPATVAPIRTPKIFVEPRSDGQGDLIRAMRENTLCFCSGACWHRQDLAGGSARRCYATGWRGGAHRAGAPGHRGGRKAGLSAR